MKLHGGRVADLLDADAKKVALDSKLTRPLPAIQIRPMLLQSIRGLFFAAADGRVVPMGFEIRGEAVLAAHSLDELKLVYRVLHAHLADHPELMDTHFLTELQKFLHNCAKQDGVDISNHGAWDAWVGNEAAPSCEVRMGARRQTDPA